MSDQFLTIRGVVGATGLSKSRIYQLVRLGEFPRPRTVEGRSACSRISLSLGWALGFGGLTHGVPVFSSCWVTAWD